MVNKKRDRLTTSGFCASERMGRHWRRIRGIKLKKMKSLSRLMEKSLATFDFQAGKAWHWSAVACF